MRYVSDVKQQEVLTLSSAKAALRKGNPQYQLYGINGCSISIGEGTVSGMRGRDLLPESLSTIDYSEIAKSARKLQNAISNRVGKPSQDVIVSARIIYAGRIMFMEESRAPQEESHFTQILLKAAWKVKTGFFTSGERLVDFSHFDIEDACDCICGTFDEGCTGDVFVEDYRNNAVLYLPAEITTKMIKACVSGLVRFGDEGRQELPVPYSVLDCSEYNGMRLAHTFDVAGQRCVTFDIRTHLQGYRFIRGDEDIRTPYGTSLKEPGRLTFSSGPRAIVAENNFDSNEKPEYDYRISRILPLVHEQYSSGSQLGFVLEGRNRLSGELGRFRVRGNPVDLLKRIKLVSEPSFYSHEEILVGAGDSLLIA